MRGEFFIDGVNSLNTYGVFVWKGGYSSLLSVPAFKSLDITDWLDEDGIEVDLSDPKLQSKTVSLVLGFTDIDLLESFYGKLMEKSSHAFEFREIGLSLEMRMLTSGGLTGLIKTGKITLSFAVDEPRIQQGSPYPIGVTRVAQRGYLLGGTDLSQFGCWVLSGTLQNTKKPTAVKQNLKVDSRYAAGTQYFPQQTGSVRCSRDVTLSLFINARSSEEFWRCYNSLFHYLTTAGMKTIRFEDSEADDECFYKSSSVRSFEITRSGTWWLMFDVTLTMING